MENAKKRRLNILAMIGESNNALSASAIASKLGVSRQVIVGDVALLRAHGHNIVATARGYITETPQTSNKFSRKIACCHTPGQTKDELYLLVDSGAIVVDVVIEHEVYGELTGYLGIKTRADVDDFVNRFEQAGAKLLSELTGGIHLHTISCESEEHFIETVRKLKNAGYLVSED